MVSRGGITLLGAAGSRVMSQTSASFGMWPIPSFIPFTIGVDDPILKFNILGSLFVQGALVASKVTCDQIFAMSPRCRIFNSADQTVVNAVGLDPVLFNSEDYSRYGMHSLTTNTGRITINTTGNYWIWAMVIWDQNAVGGRAAIINKNGAALSGWNLFDASVKLDSLDEAQHLGLHDFATAGDYYSLRVYSEMGSDRTLKASTKFGAFWTGM